jgi:uncharacterized protein (TIGR02145 family)
VRIGDSILHATGASYTPTHVKKGTTRNANNAGMYRFYCVATNQYGTKLESQVAEVAVGCGAKNNWGEWITFMCFNLGAQHGITINGQINYPISSFTNNPTSGLHDYILGEENVWGDLYQWGRVHDGHQERQSLTVSGSGMTANALYNGPTNGTTTVWPYQQVHKDSTVYFGKFITGVVANDYNWRPLGVTANEMWQSGRFRPNDPCARYRAEDSSYTDLESADEPGTAWRLPSQSDWGEIFRGGALAGTSATATANTWEWNSSKVGGYEIRPDGQTTTLFLPASGYRHGLNASLLFQGTNGFYWSTTYIGSNAYDLHVRYPGGISFNTDYRSYGLALRCIKNS